MKLRLTGRQVSGPAAGSREQEAGNREQGTGNRKQDAGSVGMNQEIIVGNNWSTLASV